MLDTQLFTCLCDPSPAWVSSTVKMEYESCRCKDETSKHIETILTKRKVLHCYYYYFFLLFFQHVSSKDWFGPDLGKGSFILAKLQGPPHPLLSDSAASSSLHLSWGRQEVKGGSKNGEPRAVSSICLRGSAVGTEQPLQMPKVKSITNALGWDKIEECKSRLPEIRRQPGASKMQLSCQRPTSAKLQRKGQC